MTVVRELADDAVVFGEILPPATRVADTGDAEAVHLAHEVARGIQLVVEGKVTCFGNSSAQRMTRSLPNVGNSMACAR